MLKPKYRLAESPGVLRLLETGSQVYGNPKPTSDWDVVLLCDGVEVRDRIASQVGGADNNEYEDASVRDGDVNYILTASRRRFDAWRRGTERCLAEAPVTRERAVEIHSEERRKSRARI